VSFSQAQLEAAITALSQPGRLADSQALVASVAPGLERVLVSALHEGGWFDAAHEAAVRDAAGNVDVETRLVALRTLFAEETRLTLLVGVAVGLELARELERDASGRDAVSDTYELED
jgi:hypothetical protein